MDPLEIKIPLKVDESQLIKLEIEDAPIKLKVKDNSAPIKLKIADQGTISLKVEKETPIKLKVSEGGSSGEYPSYRGPFVVTPLPYDDITLSTSQKLVPENITVLKIPHWETSNLKGKTFIIGG